MNLYDASPTPKSFRPRVGRAYYCDNYTLTFRPRTAEWVLLLDEHIVLTSKSNNFSSIMECFEWVPWKEEYSAEFFDTLEWKEEQARNLHAFLSSEYLTLPVEKSEIRSELIVTDQELGYYSEFMD